MKKTVYLQSIVGKFRFLCNYIHISFVHGWHILASFYREKHHIFLEVPHSEYGKALTNHNLAQLFRGEMGPTFGSHLRTGWLASTPLHHLLWSAKSARHKHGGLPVNLCTKITCQLKKKVYNASLQTAASLRTVWGRHPLSTWLSSDAIV